MNYGDFPIEETIHVLFTTRAFATGIPGTLSAATVAVYEDITATPIETSIAVTESLNSIAGLNAVPIVAIAASGYEVGKNYHVVIEAGTVDSVSVVGEVVAYFSIGRSAAAVDLANGTDGLGAIKTETAAIFAGTVTNAQGADVATDVANMIDGNNRVDVGSWLGNAVTHGTGGPDVNVNAISDDTTAAANLELFTEVLENGTGLIDAGTFKAGAIDASAIATDAITAAKIAANAITSSEIADGAITAAKITAMDSTAWGNAQNFFDTTGWVGGTTKLTVDATAISGDATAADNLEAMYDGTGYNDATAPSSRAQVGALGTSSGGALSFEANADNSGGAIDPGSTAFVGVETNDFTDTDLEDGVYHIIADDTNVIDVVYGFSVGGGRTASEMIFKGFANANNDDLTISVWDHVGAGWDAVGTLSGQNGSSNVTITEALLSRHTGTGSELGKTYVRFNGSGLSANADLNADQILIEAVGIGQTVGYANGQIWLDTVNGVAGTEAFVNGVADNPTNLIASLKTLSTSVGISDFHVVNGSTATLAESTVNESYFGDNWTLDLNGQDVAGAYFQGAIVSGVGTSATEVHYEGCEVGTMSVQNGHFDFCSFDGTVTHTLAGDNNYHNCYSKVAGAGGPTFTKTAGQAITAQWRNWAGTITVSGIEAGDVMTISGTELGNVVLNGAEGTVKILGIYESLTDNRTGSPTLIEGAFEGSDVTDILADTGTDGVIIAAAQGPVAFTGVSNEAGITAIGNGTGPGFSAIGGATGHGIEAVGGATSGDGVHANADGGGNGMDMIGVGANAGLRTEGGATGPGIHAHGGATGATPGVEFHAHSGTGDALELEVDGTGDSNADLAAIKVVTDTQARSSATIVDGAAETGTLSTTEMTTGLTISVADQYNGRIIIFASDTTTAGLRGQATDITATTILNGKLGFTALTTAPANGDTFAIV